MMRRTVLPLLVLSLVSAGCEKALQDVEDYYPTVRTESVTANSDGSVLVTGRIVSAGDSPIEVAGFCAGGSPLPAMHENQAIAEITGDLFTATYSSLDPYATYYFRAWATNENGYSYGEVLSIDSVTAVPIDPPCSPAPNSVAPGGGLQTQTYYPIEAIEQSGTDYTFQANSSAHFVTYSFGGTLATGLRTTTTSSDPSGSQMHVSFFSGFLSGVLSSGTPVYVEQLSPTTWEITICNAPWTYNSSTFQFTTRLIAHL